MNEKGYKELKYWNHRLVEMELCAMEQGYFEDWGDFKGINLRVFLIIDKIIRVEISP